MKKFTDSNAFSLLVILTIAVCFAFGASCLLNSIGTATVIKATESVFPKTAFLGINYDFVPQVGVRVFQIVPGTPAENSGIRPGDIIRKIDDLYIWYLDDVQRHLSFKQPGDTIILLIVRGEKVLKISATLIARPPGK